MGERCKIKWKSRSVLSVRGANMILLSMRESQQKSSRLTLSNLMVYIKKESMNIMTIPLISKSIKANRKRLSLINLMKKRIANLLKFNQNTISRIPLPPVRISLGSSRRLFRYLKWNQELSRLNFLLWLSLLVNQYRRHLKKRKWKNLWVELPPKRSLLPQDLRLKQNL